MKRIVKRGVQFTVSVFVLVGSIACFNSCATTTGQIQLSKHEVVQLAPRPPVSEVEAAKISALIKKLALIDKPDFGLSATLSGDAFAPIASAREFHAGLITNQCRPNSPVNRNFRSGIPKETRGVSENEFKDF